MSEIDRLVRVPEIIQVTGSSKRTVFYLLSSGALRRVKRGRSTGVMLSELRVYIKRLSENGHGGSLQGRG
jgi:predicted DNA-binding transcriptional regulator AlpA